MFHYIEPLVQWKDSIDVKGSAWNHLFFLTVGHANHSTSKNTWLLPDREPPSVGLFTLIPRRLGSYFMLSQFNNDEALVDKAGSFMVDLKEMRATNLLCLVAT